MKHVGAMQLILGIGSLELIKFNVQIWLDYYGRTGIQMSRKKLNRLESIVESSILFIGRKYIKLNGKFPENFVRNPSAQPSRLYFTNGSSNFSFEDNSEEAIAVISLRNCLKESIRSVAAKEAQVKYRVQKQSADGKTLLVFGSVWNNGRVFNTAMRMFDAQFQVAANILHGNISLSQRDFEGEENPWRITARDILRCVGIRGKSIARGVSKLLVNENDLCWNLQIIERKSFTLDEIWNLVRNHKYVRSNSNFEADPFLVSVNAGEWVVYEKLIQNKGQIWVGRIQNERIVEEKPLIVEDFHLSYPFSIVNENEVLICPETSERGEIRLYISHNFPNEVSFNQILIHDVVAIDTNMFREGIYWYLNTTINFGIIQDNFCTTWMLKSSNLSSNNWEVMNNYLITNSELVRNGGYILNQGEHLRVNQTAEFAEYGSGIAVHILKDLHSKEVSEELITSDLKPNASLVRIHHLNVSEKYIALDFAPKAKGKN